MPQAAKNKIAVVGAGIVGVSAAIWLRRAGKDVTLIDRNTPGQGTSHGNAGILASCSVAPLTAPGLALQGPKLLLDPNFPLFIRWSYLPRLAPWLVRYLSNANDADTRRIARGLTNIVADSVEQHHALADNTAAAGRLVESDYSFAYSNRKAYENDAYVWELRRDAGFAPIEIEGADVHDYEPGLSPKITFVAAMKNHGFIHNPGDYVADLAQTFVEMGGTLVRADVKGFDLSGGSVSAIETDNGRFPCDAAVLTTGVWSKPLMKKLGINVPIESERGYHIIYKNPSVKLRAPLMITAGKFVATPMQDGLRCAGVVEYGGLAAGASKAPLALMRKKIHETFPDLVADSEIEWLGHRPAPSDSLPLVGEIRDTGVYAGFGHHHIGLTGGPKTGRLLADLIDGKLPNIDMSPYNPNRFAKKGFKARKLNQPKGRNSMNTLALKLTTALTAATLTVAVAPASAEKWDLPMAYSASNFHSANGAEFAKCITTGTGGDIEVTTHPGGSLFKGGDIKRAVQTGQVQIGERLLSGHQNENALFGFDSVPFLATSFDDAEKLWKAGKPALEKALADQNLTLLYSVPWPPQGLYFKNETTSVAELAGVKFRSYNAATARLAELTGMLPVSIEAAEISQAFATGVADAMVSSGSTGYDRKVWESLNYFYEVDAWLPRNYMLVNSEIWGGVSDANKNVIKGCAELAEYSGTWRAKEYTGFTLQGLRDGGMTVGPASDTMTGELKEIGKTMTAEWLEATGAEGQAVVDAFNAMK